MEHHKHLGEDGIDVDLPTHLELLCLNNVLGKTFFAYVSLPLRHINASSPRKHFPDILLRLETWLRSHTEADQVALHQPSRPTLVRLCPGENIRYSTALVLALLQFLRW